MIVIAMVVLGEYTKTRGRFLLTSLVLEGYFFSSLGAVWVQRRRPDSAVSKIALGAGATALLLLLTGIWGTPNSDAYWKTAAIVTALALVLAYFAVVDLQPGRLTRLFAVKAVAVAVLMAGLGIAAGIRWPPYWWVFTVVVIVWVAALLTPTVSILGRRLARRTQGR